MKCVKLSILSDLSASWCRGFGLARVAIRRSDLWCHRLSHYLRNSSVGHLLQITLMSESTASLVLSTVIVAATVLHASVHGSASLEYWRGGGQDLHCGELWPLSLRPPGTPCALAPPSHPMRADLVRQKCHRRLVRPGAWPSSRVAQRLSRQSVALRRALGRNSTERAPCTNKTLSASTNGPRASDARRAPSCPHCCVAYRMHQPQRMPTQSRPRRNSAPVIAHERRGTRSPHRTRTPAPSATASPPHCAARARATAPVVEGDSMCASSSHICS